jgi:predicted Zn-dependent peptidase
MLKCLLLAGTVAFAAPLLAQEPGRIAYQSYTLDNGLSVILSENHTAQVVTVNVWYDVGSRNERAGRTGFAHLFEHMMFQGSDHVKKAEHFQLIERAGGGVNGSTQPDRTNYFETLPSNRLNLGLWLEADRMRSLAITEANLANQTETVKEERRLKVDNSPYGAAIFEGPQALFDSATCFPYSHSIIGSMADLDAATVDDVRDFFRLYYAPNNATLVVTGDFNPAETRRLIQQYFGDIPRGAEPPPVDCRQGFNTGPLHRRVRDANANLPAVLLMYRTPAEDHPDTPAISLLGILLGQGESSRLNQKLVREARAAVASQAIAGIFGPRRGPNFFLTYAIANQGVSPDSLERLLSGEIARLSEGRITDGELAKAKNAYRANAIRSRQTSMDIAEALQHATLFLGRTEAINTDFVRYMAVTRDDLVRVARTYFRGDNSLTLKVTPDAAGAATP